jgi:hypothetical protein
MERVTAEDTRSVGLQLGRKPRGLTGIASRCRYGYPQVVRVHPMVEGKPFPTLYWLTCPFLRLEIDRLEADGWVGRLEDRVASSPRLRRELAEARRAYVAERLAQLRAEDVEHLERSGMLWSLRERGIGGISEPERIKCLHLHVAHALADSNPIGEMALDLVSSIECPPEKVICSALGGAEQIEQINR